MLSKQSNIKLSQQEALMMWPCVEVKDKAWWDTRPGQAFSQPRLGRIGPLPSTFSNLRSDGPDVGPCSVPDTSSIGQGPKPVLVKHPQGGPDGSTCHACHFFR